MGSWVNRALISGTTIVLAGLLAACGFHVASKSHSTPKYLPTTIARLQEAVPLSGTASHAVTIPDSQVLDVAGSRIIVGVFPNVNPKSGKFTGSSGLVSVNSSTGTVTELVRLPNTLQPNAAVLTAQWLVWEPSMALSTEYRHLMAENLKTHNSWEIDQGPTGTAAMSDVKGLAIRGNTIFWLATLNLPHNVVSTTIRSYNLITRRTTVLVSDQSNVNHKVIFSMAVAPDAIWYAESLSGNIYDTAAPGQLVERGLTAPYHQLWKQPLWHAGTVYGATDNAVVFTANYHKAPNSEQNPGPYPIYEYIKGAHKLYQLAGKLAGWATVGGSYVVINGSTSATDMSLATYQVHPLPGPYGYTNGRVVVWETPTGKIGWESISHTSP